MTQPVLRKIELIRKEFKNVSRHAEEGGDDKEVDRYRGQKVYSQIIDVIETETN